MTLPQCHHLLRFTRINPAQTDSHKSISISFNTTVIFTSAMATFSGRDKPSLFLIKQVNNLSFLCQCATATDLTDKTLKRYGYYSNGIFFTLEDKPLSSKEYIEPATLHTTYSTRTKNADKELID